jgi:hypothetical protein
MVGASPSISSIGTSISSVGDSAKDVSAPFKHYLELLRHLRSLEVEEVNYHQEPLWSRKPN